MAVETELRDFLARYFGRVYSYGREGKYEHRIDQEDIDELVGFAVDDEIEQDIIDYGTEHPEAPFWDFLNFIKPGIKGDLTEEELLEDD